MSAGPPQVGAIDLSAYRIGPQAGFFPVEGFPGEHKEQLWIPEGLQMYESAILARNVEESGYEPDVVFSVARGGLAVGQKIIYSNSLRLSGTFQTYGYDEFDQPLEEPIIIGMPDITGLRPNERSGPLKVLLGDELLDSGKSLRVVVNWIMKHIQPDELRTAVIYIKDRDHVMDVDYSVRTVPDIWLDHETQASRERRDLRVTEHLLPYADRIIQGIGWLSMQPADMHILQAILARSEGHYL